MSHVATRWARRMRTGDGSAKCVLLVLATHADPTGECFPTVAQLAEESDLAVMTVRRAVTRLEKLGLVTVSSRRRKNGSQSSSLYRLALDMQDSPGPTPKRRRADSHRDSRADSHGDSPTGSHGDTHQTLTVSCTDSHRGTPRSPYGTTRTATTTATRSAPARERRTFRDEARRLNGQRSTPATSTSGAEAAPEQHPTDSSSPPAAHRHPQRPDGPGHSGRANRLVKAYVGGCRHRPPTDWLNQLARRIDSLLADAIDEHIVEAALHQLVAQPRLGPGALPSLVNELLNDPDGPPEPPIPDDPDAPLTDGQVTTIIGNNWHAPVPPPDIQAQGIHAVRAWSATQQDAWAQQREDLARAELRRRRDSRAAFLRSQEAATGR